MHEKVAKENLRDRDRTSDIQMGYPLQSDALPTELPRVNRKGVYERFDADLINNVIGRSSGASNTCSNHHQP